MRLFATKLHYKLLGWTLLKIVSKFNLIFDFERQTFKLTFLLYGKYS